jgi:signal transduction histidine kinase
VQEALTNTLKHAVASHVDVRLRYRTRELRVEVRDDGRATGNGAGTGSGLIGMRERVAAFGGTLKAAAAAGGGFAIDARFPL